MQNEEKEQPDEILGFETTVDDQFRGKRKRNGVWPLNDTKRRNWG